MSRAVFLSTLDNEIILILLLPWLDPLTIRLLDSAITCDDCSLIPPLASSLTMKWLGCLKSTVGANCLSDFPYDDSSIAWLSLRGVAVSSIVLESDAIDDDFFEGVCLPSLETLKLKYCSELSDAVIVNIVTTSPLLSILELGGCDNITDIALNSISQHCHKLKNIGLGSSSGITSKAIMKLTRGCPLLQSISFSSCSLVTDKTAKAISKYLPGLLHIDLSYNSVSDVGVIFLANGCHLLQSIIMEDSAVSNASLIAIGQNCPHLQNVNFSGGEGITDIGVSALVLGCTMLESITLTDCHEMTSESTRTIATGCPRLQYVFLHYFQYLDDDGLAALAHGCPLLKNLRLSTLYGLGDKFGSHIGMMKNMTEVMFERIGMLTDENLTDIVAGCSQLRKIELESCQSITSQAMIAIGAHCPLLTTLAFEETCMCSDAGLIALAEGCRLLEHFSATAFDPIGPSFLEAFGQHCAELRTIKMKGDMVITDDGFLSLLCGCPRLTTISFDRSERWSQADSNVTDADVRSPSTSLTAPRGAHRELREITFVDCPKITDVTLYNIVDSCTALCSLEITKCDSITDIGRAAVEAKFPDAL